MIKTTEEILRKSFDTFGAISDVSIKHKDNGIVFAFIEYESTKDAEKAVEEYSDFLWMRSRMFHRYLFFLLLIYSG